MLYTLMHGNHVLGYLGSDGTTMGYGKSDCCIQRQRSFYACMTLMALVRGFAGLGSLGTLLSNESDGLHVRPATCGSCIAATKMHTNAVGGTIDPDATM